MAVTFSPLPFRFPFVSAGLECVAVPLAVLQSAGAAPELPLEGADETVPGVMVAGTNLIEQDGQVTGHLVTRSSLLFAQHADKLRGLILAWFNPG